MALVLVERFSITWGAWLLWETGKRARGGVWDRLVEDKAKKNVCRVDAIPLHNDNFQDVKRQRGLICVFE